MLASTQLVCALDVVDIDVSVLVLFVVLACVVVVVVVVGGGGSGGLGVLLLRLGAGLLGVKYAHQYATDKGTNHKIRSH